MIKSKLFFAQLIFCSMCGPPLDSWLLWLWFFSAGSSLGMNLGYFLRTIFSQGTWGWLRGLSLGLRGGLVLDSLGAPGRGLHLLSCPGWVHHCSPGPVGAEGAGEVSAAVRAPLPVVVGGGVPAAGVPLPVPRPLLLVLLAPLLSRHVPLGNEND